MTRIDRNVPYSKAGLMQDDIDNRPIVVVGYARGEILPPYYDSREEKLAKRIRDYMKSKEDSITYKGSLSKAAEEMVPLTDGYLPPVVEVVGGMLGICVVDSVRELLVAGSRVYVNPDMIIDLHSTLPKFHKGRILLQQVLRDHPERRVIINGDEFLFYRTDYY